MKDCDAIKYLMLLIAAIILIQPVFAEQITPYGEGNASQNYSATIGKDKLEVNTNIPISEQDILYPELFFYILFISGLVFILVGIIFVSFNTHVPSIAIIACGIMAMAVFLPATYVAPLTGISQVDTQVIPTFGANGSVDVNATNTIYINHVVVYTISYPFGYACWGGFIAGFIVAILGALSLIGWLDLKGIGDAQDGRYLETDGIANPEDQFGSSGEGNYKRIGKGKAKR